MYVRLMLVGVLSASKERGEGELPGAPGLNEMTFNFGDLWGANVKTIAKKGVHIDVSREVMQPLGEAVQQISMLGVAVHTGKIGTLDLMSHIEGATVTGEVPDETLKAIGAAGLRVSAPIVPAVQN